MAVVPMRNILAAICVCVLGSVANAADAPLAKIGGTEAIDVAAYRSYVSRRIDLRDMARTYWGARTALREMAMTRLLVLEGQQMGMASANKEGGPYDDVFALSVRTKLTEQCVAPADEEARKKYYETHPDAFRIPPSARLARIKLPASLTVDGESAMAWLLDRADAIAKRKETWDTLVKRADAQYKLEAQGDLGWVQLTGDAAVIQALSDAKAGNMVGPLREGDFAYLFVVQDKREKHLLTWSEAKNTVAQRAVSYCREQAAKSLTERLFKKYAVSFDDEALRETFKIEQPRGASQESVKKAASKP